MEKLLEVCDEYPKLSYCLVLKEEFRKFFDIITKDDANAFIDYFETLVMENMIYLN